MTGGVRRDDQGEEGEYDRRGERDDQGEEGVTGWVRRDDLGE